MSNTALIKCPVCSFAVTVVMMSEDSKERRYRCSHCHNTFRVPKSPIPKEMNK